MKRNFTADIFRGNVRNIQGSHNANRTPFSPWNFHLTPIYNGGMVLKVLFTCKCVYVVCVCVCVCVRVCASVCVRAPIVWTNLFLKGEGILFAYLGERLSDKLKRGFKYDIGVCLFKKEVDTFFCLNLTLHSTDMFCLYKQRKWYISAMAAAQAGEKENQGD